VIVHVWVGGATVRVRAEPPCSAAGLATLTGRKATLATRNTSDSMDTGIESALRRWQSAFARASPEPIANIPAP
jgi:hypothetical protein